MVKEGKNIDFQKLGTNMRCCIDRDYCFPINKELAFKLIEFIKSSDNIYTIGNDNVNNSDNVKVLLNKSPNRKHIEINITWESKEYHRYYDFISVKKFKKKLNEILI